MELAGGIVDKTDLKECPICKSGTFIRTHFSNKSKNLSACPTCLAIFQNPRFIESDYGDVNLESNEFLKKKTFYGDWEGGPNPEWIRTFYKNFAVRLKSLCNTQENSKKKALDIGCAVGMLLEIWGNLEFEPYGIETSRFTAEKAKKHGEVFIGELEQYNPPHQFDVITITSVLEHVAFPLQTIKKMITLLKEGGVLGIEIPVNEIKRIRLQNLFIEDINLPEGHIFFFNRLNIQKMLSYLEGVNISVDYFGIISNKECRHAFVRESVLNKFLIKTVISILDLVPFTEKMLGLEFFARIIIKKPTSSSRQ